MLRIAVMFALIATAPAAQAPDWPCRVERLDRAKAVCLGAEADRRALATEALIAAATADLQGAFGTEIRTFERELARSQRLWRQRVRDECRAIAAGDRVAYQACRLEQAVDRHARVAESLDIARDRLGAAPLYDPDLDSVEVLIPLPDAPGGPDSDVRIPLTVPIRP